MQTAVLHHIKCRVGFIPPLNLNIIKWWDKSHPTDKKMKLNYLLGTPQQTGRLKS